ncbi:uncharacterized protein LOC144574359 [Carex rostrata]
MEEDQVLSPVRCFLLDKLHHREIAYIQSIKSDEDEKPQGWIHNAIGYWKSLDRTEKESCLLLVYNSCLDYFSFEYLKIPWLRDFLADVVTFYELYKRWDVYICPSPKCLQWFSSGDLLISHLACEHLPDIHQTNAWPLLRDWTEEKWCAETLRNTVWKPIDVECAFCLRCDACGDSHDGGSLFNNLPFSKDSRRSKLLEKLGKGFQKLIDHQEKSFFSMLSNGRLRALIRLAANHIRHPTGSISLLEQAPICFCFLEEEPLSCFVQLVDDMVHFVNQITAAPPNGIMDLSRDYKCDEDWSENGECLDALSAPQSNGSCDYFVLNEDKITCQLRDPDGVPHWVFEAPRIPSIELLPTKASEMFHQVESKVKSFVNRLTIPNMQSVPAEVVYFELWSAMCGLRNRTYGSLVDSPPSSLSAEESNLWNGESPRGSFNHSFLSFCSSEELVQFRSTAFLSKIKPGYLELIKLSFELQCLKPQIQEFCTIDLRKCILPLIRSYLRMKLYALVEVLYRPVEDTDVGKSAEKECIDWTDNDSSDVTPKAETGGETGLVAPTDSGAQVFDNWSALSVSNTEYEDEPASVPSTEYEAVNTEAALPASRTGVGMAILKSGGETGLEAPTDSRAQVFDFWSDIWSDASSTEHEDQSASVPSWVEDPLNHSLYLFLTESGLLETEVTGLLVWGSITDVIKHCVQIGRRDDALEIWERKTYKSLKYWCCCCCDSHFPCRERHMEHMECEHQLGFPHNAYWSMPVPHKQDEVKGELGSEPEEEVLSGSTVTLGGSVTFDRNFNCFLVDATKLCPIPTSNNGGEFCKDTSLSDKIQHIKDQLSILRHLFGEKYELVKLEIVQCCAQIDNLKQDLSECCLSEYNILSPIGSFIQAAFGIDSVDLFESSARQNFEAFLRSVTCVDLPSVKLELQSHGKVLIKLMEHGGRFGFAYVGMSWKFNGEMYFGGCMRTVNGSLKMVASSNWESDYFIMDEKITFKVCDADPIDMWQKQRAILELKASIILDVESKLREFEAKFPCY